MKLFIVLYVAGQIGGVWGPLPYDIDECRVRVRDVHQEISKYEEMRNWTFACEWHRETPELD